MMDEELGGVGSFVDSRNSEDRKSRRPAADAINQLGILPPLLDLGHPTLIQAGEWLCDNAGGADRVSLANPQVRRQVVGIPALAQCGCLRSDLVEQVTQLGSFGPGKRHE